MANTSSKDKKRYVGYGYIVDRQKYLSSIGDYRCEIEVDGEKKCHFQCEKCYLIYFEK